MFEKTGYNDNQLINLEKVYREIVDAAREYKIDMNDFSEIYGDLTKDAELVSRYEANNGKENTPKENEAKKIAKIFEAILCQQTELSEWLGSDVTTMLCSDYDDYVNGVDIVAEFSEGDFSPSYLGLAVDATYSSDLSKKFKKIKNEIASGKMAEIKYFKSSEMDFMGKMSQIPRVVVGAKYQTIIELVEMQKAGKKKELGNHWIQFQILEQILEQLEEFQKYADKIGQENVSLKISRVKNRINRILGNKKKMVKDSGQRDSFCGDIEKHLAEFEYL